MVFNRVNERRSLDLWLMWLGGWWNDSLREHPNNRFQRKNTEFNFGPSDFKVSVGYPRGDIQEAVGYMDLEFRKEM